MCIVLYSRVQESGTQHMSQNQCLLAYWLLSFYLCWPGSSVGIATGYGLEGRGSNPGWGRDFPHLFIPALGPSQPPVNGYRFFPGVKNGQGVTLTPHPLLVPWSRKSRATHVNITVSSYSHKKCSLFQKFLVLLGSFDSYSLLKRL